VATHVTIVPHHEGHSDRARDILQKLEAHLGIKSVPADEGYQFQFDNDDLEHNASHLSGALDLVAPDWRDHISMGL
jgi:hypothetical protein